MSALPGKVYDDASLLTLASVDVLDDVLPRAGRGLKLRAPSTRRKGFRCRVLLATSFCAAGAIGLGTTSLLALLGRGLLLLPGVEQRCAASDLGQVFIYYE